MNVQKTLSKFQIPLAIFGLLLGTYANFFLLSPPRLTQNDARILVFAEESLRYLIYASRDNSIGIFKHSKAEVEKEGNREIPMKFLAKMLLLKEATSQAINSLTTLQNERYNYQLSPEDSAKVWRKGFSNAESSISSLYRELSRYDSFLVNIDTTAYQALKKENLPLLTCNSAGKMLDEQEFSSYYFDVPQVIGFYNISRLEAAIAYREHLVMTAMGKKMKLFNVVDIAFNKFQPFATAESEVVSEGEMYKAKIFFTAYADLPVMEMSSSEGKVEVKDGIGKVRFKATADKFDENGLAKKSWKGKITLKTVRGNDTTFSIETEYIVKKKQQ